MIKINYKEPEEFETIENIAIFNIQMCNKYKKADYLELSSISWLKINNERNFQDLENLFRKLDLDAFVIAQEINNIPTGLRIGKPNESNTESETQSKTETESKTKTESKTETESKIETESKTESLEYIAKIICINKDNYITELSKYNTSLEENYKRLIKTGCLMAIDQEKVEDEKNNEINGVNEIKKLLECKLKLDLEYYRVEESINFIISDLTKKYGKEPEKTICGEIGTNKVWALMLDGKIVSPIGWTEKNNIENNNLIDYELIDFRKINIEK